MIQHTVNVPGVALAAVVCLWGGGLVGYALGDWSASYVGRLFLFAVGASLLRLSYLVLVEAIDA